MIPNSFPRKKYLSVGNAARREHKTLSEQAIEEVVKELSELANSGVRSFINIESYLEWYRNVYGQIALELMIEECKEAIKQKKNKELISIINRLVSMRKNHARYTGEQTDFSHKDNKKVLEPLPDLDVDVTQLTESEVYAIIAEYEQYFEDLDIEAVVKAVQTTQEKGLGEEGFVSLGEIAALINTVEARVRDLVDAGELDPDRAEIIISMAVDIDLEKFASLTSVEQKEMIASIVELDGDQVRDLLIDINNREPRVVTQEVAAKMMQDGFIVINELSALVNTVEARVRDLVDAGELDPDRAEIIISMAENIDIDKFASLSADERREFIASVAELDGNEIRDMIIEVNERDIDFAVIQSDEAGFISPTYLSDTLDAFRDRVEEISGERVLGDGTPTRDDVSGNVIGERETPEAIARTDVDDVRSLVDDVPARDDLGRALDDVVLEDRGTISVDESRSLADDIPLAPEGPTLVREMDIARADINDLDIADISSMRRDEVSTLDHLNFQAAPVAPTPTSAAPAPTPVAPTPVAPTFVASVPTNTVPPVVAPTAPVVTAPIMQSTPPVVAPPTQPGAFDFGNDFSPPTFVPDTTTFTVVNNGGASTTSVSAAAATVSATPAGVAPSPVAPAPTPVAPTPVTHTAATPPSLFQTQTQVAIGTRANPAVTPAIAPQQTHNLAQQPIQQPIQLAKFDSPKLFADVQQQQQQQFVSRQDLDQFGINLQPEARTNHEQNDFRLIEFGEQKTVKDINDPKPTDFTRDIKPLGGHCPVNNGPCVGGCVNCPVGGGLARDVGPATPAVDRAVLAMVGPSF